MSCGLQWTGDRGLSMSLFWFEICTGAGGSTGAGSPPLTTGRCDETHCKQMRLQWFLTSHWSRVWSWPSDWLILSLSCTFTLIFSVACCTCCNVASALSETIRSKNYSDHKINERSNRQIDQNNNLDSIYISCVCILHFLDMSDVCSNYLTQLQWWSKNAPNHQISVQWKTSTKIITITSDSCLVSLWWRKT